MNYVSVQELAYAAEDFADVQVDAGGEFHVHYTRKFAELLIRECLLVISKTPNLLTDEEVAVMVKCHNHVEKHFGVE